MAKKTAATAEDVRAAIADRPRQSVNRYVELFNIVNTLAPERLEEFFTPELIDQLSEVADQQRNPVTEAYAKVNEKQLELAINALTNDNKQQGYAPAVFTWTRDAYDERNRPKAKRTKKSVVDKFDELINSASDEEREALQAIMQSRNLV